MKNFILLLLIAFSIGSSYGQVTSIHLESIQDGVYTGSVNPVDFPTHNFSGETIQINSAGQTSVTIQLLFDNLTQTQQEWMISRKRINVNPSIWEYIFFGETTDVFGGIGMDISSTGNDLWVAPANMAQTVDSNQVFGLSGFLTTNTTGGCGTYRYYLGTVLDPFQQTVDV
jgi:hypothetical protein